MKKLLFILLCLPFIGSAQNIGDYYQGGIVFYINGNGGGLVAAAHDITDNSGNLFAEWGCYGNSFTGADGLEIGTGKQNTIDIVAFCDTVVTAADICANLILEGYSDWFLPSRDELKLMHQTIGNEDSLGLGNIGNLCEYTNPLYPDSLVCWYWSSSEYNNHPCFAWEMNLYTGELRGLSKQATKYMRPIRCINNECSSLTAIKEQTSNKELLKVTDLLGRETKQTNQPLFYMYDDGTVEKRIVIE